MVPIRFKSKETDAVGYVHPAIFQAISMAAWSVWAQFGAEELVVTALRDGSHRVGSRHKQEICTAVDIRSKGPGAIAKEEDRVRAREVLQATLGSAYKVILENLGEPNEHIHVSYVADGKPA